MWGMSDECLINKRKDDFSPYEARRQWTFFNKTDPYEGVSFLRNKQILHGYRSNFLRNAIPYGYKYTPKSHLFSQSSPVFFTVNFNQLHWVPSRLSNRRVRFRFPSWRVPSTASRSFVLCQDSLNQVKEKYFLILRRSEPVFSELFEWRVELVISVDYQWIHLEATGPAT